MSEISKYCLINAGGELIVSSVLFDQRTSQFRKVTIKPEGIQKHPNSLKFLGECISDNPK